MLRATTENKKLQTHRKELILLTTISLLLIFPVQADAVELTKGLKIVIEFTKNGGLPQLRNAFLADADPLIDAKIHERLDANVTGLTIDKKFKISKQGNDWQVYPKYVLKGTDTDLSQSELETKIGNLLDEIKAIVLTFLQNEGASNICWHIHYPTFNFDGCEP